MDGGWMVDGLWMDGRANPVSRQNGNTKDEEDIMSCDSMTRLLLYIKREKNE